MTSEGFAKPWAEFEEEFGERLLIQGDLTSCQDGFARIGAKMVSKYQFPPPDPAIQTEEKTVDGLRFRIYTPKNYAGGKPVGVYFHGGGWAMGDLDGDDAFCRQISKGGNVVLVSVEYGLAPQNKHPGLINDCWKGLNWTLSNAKDLGGIEGKIFTAGTSAGGQLALSLALKALDEGLEDSLVGVVAQVPATIHPAAVPENLKSKYTSTNEHAEHTVNSKSAMQTFWDAFGIPPNDPYASPLLHPRINDLKKVYMTVAGHDTLRDDGLLFKQKLDDADVSSKLDFYPGYPHYHWAWPSPKLKETEQEYISNLAKGVQFVVS
ncbi:hypothetical protein BS50DRAFT_555344 [Corynespora cassiicola Philippines]|uniref:Alpha/beta hydrolase fold-3 domain-containing protein n=1 Tax=Corynespora cassiicola Philippines TaxID=1448308 RepID=A0A2T2NI30_CORCC|nr:hypothetical protein BS50DRAFT_555344 [Corynespora cassiicola Philippines]